MPEPNQPPPGQTLLAAAAGAFGGAVVGVIAATALMGNGDSNDGQAAAHGQETPVAVEETELASR